MKIDTGASLRVAQAKAQINSSDLARVLDIYPQQIMRWRNGQDMKVSLAIRFSKHFGITLNEFLALGAKND
jgi:plasmid maintenance system antidote protein VapI